MKAATRGLQALAVPIPFSTAMNFFERLTGFPERDYVQTRDQLEVVGKTLRSKVNGAAYGIGEFELVELGTLRDRVAKLGGPAGHPRVSVVQADVRVLHQAPEYKGALFQVASQTNCLEMVGPDVTPEDGVTRYEHDRTQGPACAMAAGAATIFRNYFVAVGEQQGQTAQHQLDGLADVGAALSSALNRPADTLWRTRNGYALASREGLNLITAHLGALDEQARDDLAGKLRIGIHRDVEVTYTPNRPGPNVSQAFCSALPVAYSGVAGTYWQPFAQFVLDAAYEATMLEAVLNAQRGASNVVLLTMLGGGAFGNDEEWIRAAIRRAVRKVLAFDLDVRLVSYRSPSSALRALVQDLQAP
ncbi:hypothetical protein [Variovorax guangxiensis]|uniref:hypothetical protein n=1 Tax=Variovorax guangxiensis TaxID=1775474 RepID=UPI00285BF34F|nr:hypothetical protein [Variovorax guangxiensis]MDR6855302.1 hypothetical protein [Variovorax guangxiensis]